MKEDARLKKLTPTAKATGVRQRILDNIHYIEELLARDIPEEKLTVCREVLQQMSENLSGDEKKREEITDHDRILLRSVREYKRESFLTPVLVCLKCSWKC